MCYRIFYSHIIHLTSVNCEHSVVPGFVHNNQCSGVVFLVSCPSVGLRQPFSWVVYLIYGEVR